MTARTANMARRLWAARCARQNYANLPDELAPASIPEAYAAQTEYWRLAEPVYGPVAGLKVAVTTKVMQQLMGINHACGGGIFANTIHASGVRIAKDDFVNLRVESEIALKIGADMPASRGPWTAETVVPFVAGAMPWMRRSCTKANSRFWCSGLHRLISSINTDSAPQTVAGVSRNRTPP